MIPHPRAPHVPQIRKHACGQIKEQKSKGFFFRQSKAVGGLGLGALVSIVHDEKAWPWPDGKALSLMDRLRYQEPDCGGE